MPQPVYLDYNATAPVRPEAVEAAAEAMAYVGNASSVHRFGRDARRRVETAREAVATLVGARPGAVVFTSGGTEANNTVLRAHAGQTVLVSAIEHDCVLGACPEAVRIPVTAEGVVDLAALERQLAAGPPPALISVMLANNETGVVQPVADVARLARHYGARVHCDAIQAAGKIPVDVGELGADLVTLSAHKLGGPQGVGAMIVRDDRPLMPHLRGGGQERGYRAGTENVPGIAAFGAAADKAHAELGQASVWAAWREQLEAGARRVCPNVVIHGAGAPRLPNTSCIGLPGLPVETQLMKMDLAGIAVSAGSACSSGKVRASHVLTAMGAAQPGEALRVSLGWDTRREEIDRFLSVWRRLAEARAAA